MWGSSKQAGEALCVLASRFPGLEKLWTEEGPTLTVSAIREGRERPSPEFSHSRAVYWECLWTLWTGDGNIPWGDCVRRLDGGNMRALTALMAAYSEGEKSI